MSMAEKKEILEKRSGTVLLDHDIKNASAKLKNEISDEESCRSILADNGERGGFSKTFKDQDGNFVCLCVATKEMLETLALYPQRHLLYIPSVC